MQLINSVFYYFLKLIMESEGERKIKEFVSVKDLQSSLFPSGKKNVTGSYFANFLMKASNTEEESDDDIIKIKRAHSRELYSIGRDSILANQPARWPTECQVLDERIFHINYNPPTLEPYYQPTGREVQPKPTGDECGIIVYQYTPISAVNYFTRSSIGGSKYLLSTNICPEEDSLKFESRFESGNLARAVRITPHYYELHLRSDLYTHRHMQWFYFRVTNMKKFQLYRFSIVNLTKEGSLYNEGMKPLMYSKTDAQTHLIGWRRCGENITYFNNDITTTETDQQTTYTLTFTVMFPHDNDEVYLANCYPYTYSDLQDYLLELTAHPVKSSYTTLRLLCKTLAGNNVYYITITSPPASVDFDGSGNGEPIKKKAVVLSARVHPGETPSSWIMKGVIDFLTGDSSPAKELRDKFIFKLVPMLNPDGVIVGNTRCSLSAKDLNRQYRTVMRDAYPSIWYTKLMIRRLLEECGVSLYCDFHAHSRKHNIFIYGCENRNGGDKKLQEQVFPLMLHKNTADKFSFEDCKFRIQKAKEGTGRVVMWMMGIVNSYTLEASFAGSTLGNRNETHFSALDFEQMGRSFCQTLLDFYDEEPRKEKLRTKILCRLTMEGSNADEPTNIPLSDFSSDEGDTSSSSNEGGNFHPYKSIPPPPPSPMHMKKPKPKKDLKNKKQSKNKCVFLRKPLPIRKATLSLGVSTNGSDESETSSETEDEHEKAMVEKIRFVRRRKCKKKTLRKQEPAIEAPVSDAETPVIKSTVSVLEFIPDENKKNAIPRDRTPQPQWPARHTQLKSATEIKLSKQLEEVQSKLLAIKSKLWYGTGNGDLNEPLSWGLSTMNLEDSTSRSPNKCHKKHSKRRQSKSKLEKVPPAKEKQKKTENKMNCSKKSQNGLKRQSAIEVPLKEKLIRKSRSLPDASDSKFKEKTKIVLNSSDEPDVTNNIKNTKETSNTKTRKKSAKKHKFAKTTSLNGKVPSRKV